MINRERPTDEQLWQNMLTFANQGLDRGVWSYLISDGPDKSSDEVNLQVGIFPQVSQESILVLLGGKRRHKNPIIYYRNYLKLELPESLTDLKGADIEQVKIENQLRSSFNKWPSILLSVKEQIKPQDDILIFSGIVGLAPATALNQFKERIKVRLRKFN